MPAPHTYPRSVAGLVGVVVLAATTGATEREADACSCAGPGTALLGPDRVDDAPLNSRVRIEGPSGAMNGFVLRVHGGKDVAATSTKISPGGWLEFLELTPAASLAPSTQYEIATLDPGNVPSATVIGTFRTGTSADTTAPILDALGPATAFKNSKAVGSMCQIAGPWVVIDNVHARDPGRPDAKLTFGVWLGDAAGNVDPKKPPTALVRTTTEKLGIGQSSACDPHSFPIPRAAAMWLGIAAIDEAGNTSAIRRVRADLAGARQP